MKSWLGFSRTRFVSLFGYQVTVPDGMSEELFEHFIWALGRVEEE